MMLMVMAAGKLVLATELVLANATATAVKHWRRTLGLVVATVVLMMVTPIPFAVLSDRRGIFFVVFETLLSAQVATVLEHVTGIWVQGPKRSLARFVRCTGHFNETIVERQRVPDGILPPLLILSVERE